MKTTTNKIIFSSALILGILAGPAIAQADSTASTKGSINFTHDNNGPYQPVDPNDPSKLLDPEDPDNPNTGNFGDLALTVAPKSFDFGNQKKYSAAHTYNAQASGNNDQQYLQVNDNRDAGTQGWKVTAKQDRDLTDDQSKATMTGVTFYIPNGEVHNSIDSQASGLSASSATVTPDSDSTVFTADSQTDNSGKDASTDTWKSTDVTLNIPANTAKDGNFSNNIKWTLTAAVD